MVVADPDGLLLTVCENGYGKRTPFGANSREAGEAERGLGGFGPGRKPDDRADPTARRATRAMKRAGDPSGMRYRLQRRGGKGSRT